MANVGVRDVGEFGPEAAGETTVTFSDTDIQLSARWVSFSPRRPRKPLIPGVHVPRAAQPPILLGSAASWGVKASQRYPNLSISPASSGQSMICQEHWRRSEDWISEN